MARLHTLIPSPCKPAYPAALEAKDAETRLSVIDAARSVCAVCTSTANWLDLSFIDNNPRNFARENLRPACPLCRSGQSLHRPKAALEFLPVWLPEVDQIAVNRITGLLHRRLILAGESPVIDHRHRPALDDPTTRDLVTTYLGFANRRALLGVLLGGYAPTTRELVTLFYGVDPGRGRCPDSLAVGLRLLPLGRYFHEGRDCYAEALGIAAPVAPPAKQVQAA